RLTEAETEGRATGPESLADRRSHSPITPRSTNHARQYWLNVTPPSSPRRESSSQSKHLTSLAKIKADIADITKVTAT
ncbi:hypothetical protein A2U01_0094203, partial [Trifolium medium]|nr:hypothetical protein [Trifolium medium]